MQNFLSYGLLIIDAIVGLAIGIWAFAVTVRSPIKGLAVHAPVFALIAPFVLGLLFCIACCVCAIQSQNLVLISFALSVAGIIPAYFGMVIGFFPAHLSYGIWNHARKIPCAGR